MYCCLCGGKGKFSERSKDLEKKKSLVSIGTWRLGCPASFHLRLLNVSNGMKILDIRLPLPSAHLSTHTPSSIKDQLTMKPLPEVEQKVTELMEECFLNHRAFRMLLKNWVKSELL